MMYTFVVNGQKRESPTDGRLIDFLRDMGLTSVKNACSEGACGACTVLIDGKKVRSCLTKLSRVAGKNVLTLEGLTQREKDVYSYCFAFCGAVQCGFCTPGMIISAKALIDSNPNPTPEEVKAAIKGNICRCTGYKKIEEAIMLAAEYMRENADIPSDCADFRPDAREKALGEGLFADDVTIEGMIYAKALRSRYPRARVVKIDVSRALAHPDAVAVLTAKDVPFNKTGHLIPDWDVMIGCGDITRTVGDAVALAASKNKYTLEEILSLIDVEYEELTPVTDPQKALLPGAPLIHEAGNLLSVQTLRRGDAASAIANSKYSVTRHYSTPMNDHAFMEPECAIAAPDGDGVVVLSGSQSVYDEKREISRMLNIAPEKVRCRSMLVGGGFGGKEDMSVQHHAALMAWVTKRPVKVTFTRQESLEVHTKRHAMEIDVTTACDENGMLTGMKAEIVSDCGAYASLGGPVLQRACTHAAGPYNFHNIDITGKCVYTNNVPGGAYRGFGVTQSCFATEMNLNLLAEKCGISPWEIRYRNAVEPGQELPNGQIVSSDCAIRECLLAVKPAFLSSPTAGIACCMKNSGLGVGVPDVGRAKLVAKGGFIHILTSAACMGQGIAAVASNIASSVTGLPTDIFKVARPDTGTTPNSGTSTASRQTLFMGEAVRRAAEKLKEALIESSLGALEGREFDGEYVGQTDPMGSEKPHPVSHIAYSYAAQVVIMDGNLRPIKVVAAHDVGRVISRKSCEGQVEGGVLMGLGFALSENFKMENGYVKSRYSTLGLLRSTDAPEIETILIEKGDPDGLALGAKGVGEISAIPTAPAAALAAYRADGVFRTKLPFKV